MRQWTTEEGNITFEFDKVESDKYREFETICKNAKEGGIEITFIPTGIGTAIKVKHTGLNIKTNITNYDDW